MWKELGHQMVLTKHNENKPNALCSQKHGMQNFPNIQRRIDSQRALIEIKIEISFTINQLVGTGEIIPHKYIFCDLILEGLQVAILSTCKILVQPNKFRLCGAKQRLVFH